MNDFIRTVNAKIRNGRTRYYVPHRFYPNVECEVVKLRTHRGRIQALRAETGKWVTIDASTLRPVETHADEDDALLVPAPMPKPDARIPRTEDKQVPMRRHFREVPRFGQKPKLMEFIGPYML